MPELIVKNIGPGCPGIPGSAVIPSSSVGISEQRCSVGISEQRCSVGISEQRCSVGISEQRCRVGISEQQCSVVTLERRSTVQEYWPSQFRNIVAAIVLAVEKFTLMHHCGDTHYSTTGTTVLGLLYA
jgi:hypothetical protein